MLWQLFVQEYVQNVLLKKKSKMVGPHLPHDCAKNYSGLSKGMESFAGVQLVTKIWDHKEHKCAINRICADDDSTICAQMKHSYKELIVAGCMTEEDWPRTVPQAGNRLGSKKSDTGRLPIHVTVVPSWVADPNHQKKHSGTKCTQLIVLPRRLIFCIFPSILDIS